jgi:hypothetical protein
MAQTSKMIQSKRPKPPHSSLREILECSKGLGQLFTLPPWTKTDRTRCEPFIMDRRSGAVLERSKHIGRFWETLALTSFPFLSPPLYPPDTSEMREAAEVAGG